MLCVRLLGVMRVATINKIARTIVKEYGFDFSVTYVVTYLTVLRLSGVWLKVLAVKDYINGVSPAEVNSKYKVDKTVLRGVYQRLRDMFAGLPAAARDDFLRFVINRAFRGIWEAGSLIISKNVCVECGVIYEAPRTHVLRHHVDLVKEKVVQIIRSSGLDRLKIG